MEKRNFEPVSTANASEKKRFFPKTQTRKQTRQSAVLWLVFGLVSLAGAIGFCYWDYREQVKFYNFWERGSGIDFKTGKPIPNYQPPPFIYQYDRMFFLPHIVIFGGISLLFLSAGIHELQKSRKMNETAEMRRADAERETRENSPEVKNLVRQELTIRLLPIVLLIPVPFIAIYGLGAMVFAVYIFFVAIIVGASYFVVPRLMRKNR